MVKKSHDDEFANSIRYLLRPIFNSGFGDHRLIQQALYNYELQMTQIIGNYHNTGKKGHITKNYYNNYLIDLLTCLLAYK